MKLLSIFFMLLFCFASVHAEVVTEVIEYMYDDAVLEGYLAYDNAITGKRPGVLVVHAWKGLGDYAKMRARMLAEMGYIAFAADIYGKGIRPTTNEEAAKQATIYRSNRPLQRSRVKAGLDVLKNHKLCDASRVAAIGYCFGGGTVLELARSGAELSGVVSFHGNLDTPDPSVAQNIKCKVLVCHGADDPHVPFTQVQGFMEEMSAAKVDYQFIAYGGAVHAFTEKAAGNDPSIGVAYNADAERRSWDHMKLFFAELFK
ncbi:MAG: dienelactone hydrolase family protein [Candidatus Zixiibacteriota bacterium]